MGLGVLQIEIQGLGQLAMGLAGWPSSHDRSPPA